MIAQLVGVTWLNLTNLRSRLGGSAIVVVGIGGVVAVLLSLLAMSNGFSAALVDSAQPGRAVIVRNGSNGEMDGWISRDELNVIQEMPDFEIVSGEVYATISVTDRSSGMTVDAVARGVPPAAFELRPELNVVRGRTFASGKHEAVVGRRAAQQFAGLEIGDVIRARHADWEVVGHFEAGGTAVESEIWIDRPVAQDVFRREEVSLARVKLVAGVDVEALNSRFESDPRVTGVVIPETVFYAAQSRARASMINTFAYLIAAIMGLGSVVAALNAMYAAVSRRKREIATLRALGFGGAAVVMSVLIEAVVLALLGALVACGGVFLIFDGLVASTVSSGSQVAFAFRMNGELLTIGIACALALGFCGGLLPAVSAARQPVATALKAGGR